MEIGYLKGETCNRDDCKGVIQEKESDYGCSCHINPPCSYCETSREYCSECDWDGQEEQVESHNKATNYFVSSGQEDYYTNQRKEQEKLNEIFYKKYRGELPITEFEYRHVSTGYASMNKIGVYPEGITRSEVEKKVKGSWGGKFLHFGNGKFEYTAYTD